MAGTLNACVAGFALLCFVLGLLVSQPKVPINVNVTFPKLSGESAYSLMALLGGNVIANNFYVHSSMAQVNLSLLLVISCNLSDNTYGFTFVEVHYAKLVFQEKVMCGFLFLDVSSMVYMMFHVFNN
jgi:ethylene-insensitive protein 2